MGGHDWFQASVSAVGIPAVAGSDSGRDTYQEHVIVVPSGCIHTFTADIWLVGGGEMNVIIWQVGA